MRRIGWRTWLLLLVLIAGTGLGGYPLQFHVGGWDDTLFRWATLLGFAARLAFIVIYTIFGLRRPPGWWKWNVGTVIVLMQAAGLAYVAPLAWAVTWHHGSITGPLAAWIEVDGMADSTALVAWASLMWLRIGRKEQADDAADDRRDQSRRGGDSRPLPG